MSVVERVRPLVTPIVTDLGLDLYDLEHTGGTLRVVVSKPGGVDLDTISLATRLISRELDAADPFPGRYTLEVSSPGLERRLRTPEHFAGAVGSLVAVRTHPEVEGPRRLQGVLGVADDDGIVIRVLEGPDVGEHRLAYHDVERARTVFEWGGAPKPSGKPAGKAARPVTKGAPRRSERPSGQREAGAS